MRRVSLFMLLVIALMGGGWFGLGPLERKAIYPFDKRRVDPAALGLSGMTEVLLRPSGQRMVIWVARPKPGKPTVFYLHGNAGNLANRGWRFQYFIERGYGVIAPAYRGSSGSTGLPSEKAITRDMRKIYSDLDALVPGLTANQTVLYGESLGTGVALKLLNSEKIPQPKGVVLEAPYTSLPDIVREQYPHLESLIPKMKNTWNSVEHVKSLKAPLLVMHGTKDQVIPIEQGRAVYEAAGSLQKKWLKIPGANHSETWRTDTMPKLWRFIDGF